RVHQNERDEQHDYRLEIDSAMDAVDDHARPGRKQTFSLDQLHQRAGPGSDAAVEITGAEVRRDHVAHDALRDGVGDRALEAAPAGEVRPARRTPAATRPSQRPRMEGLPLRRRGGLAEIDRRRLGDGLFVFDAEARLHRVAEQHRRQVDRKLAYEHVVFLYGFYVAVARDGNAVLRALELRLQVAEVRVRLELGIILGDEPEPSESARHSRLLLL